MYLYDMPYAARKALCCTLDADDSWKLLAGIRLNYSHQHIQTLQRELYIPGRSPTDALLTHWGQRNGTVEELFTHLHALSLHRAMAAISECVPNMRKFIRADTGPAEQTSTSPLGPAPPPPPLPITTDINVDHSHTRNDLLANLEAAQKEKKIEKKLTNLRDFDASSTVPAFESARTATTAPHSPFPSARTASLMPQPHLLPTDSSIRRMRQISGVPGVPAADPDFLIKNVPYDNLKKACKDFALSEKLGQGGFGEVFHGKWNGQEVAVKRIVGKNARGKGNNDVLLKCINQAMTELNALHSYPAENILQLLAVSFDETFKTDPCLVYQYMLNGSVADRLRRKNETAPLTWEQRANIALGTARGLWHLHANNIIHGDIKSGNILLDKHFEAKIGDFGLARGGPENAEDTHKMVSSVQGTFYYLPMDYVRNKELTPAVDTFSFGIFMLELVTSHTPSFKPPPNMLQLVALHNPLFKPEQGTPIRDILLDKRADVAIWVDPNAPRANSHCSGILFQMGRYCAQENRKERPSMEEVLDLLEKLESRFIGALAPLALQQQYDSARQKVQNIPVPQPVPLAQQQSSEIPDLSMLQSTPKPYRDEYSSTSHQVESGGESRFSSDYQTSASSAIDETESREKSNLSSESKMTATASASPISALLDDGIPNLPALRISGPSFPCEVDDRVRAMEAAARQLDEINGI